MTTRSRTAVHQNVVCPFCSLLCDDLVVECGATVSVRANGCPRSVRGFERSDPSIGPHVHGKAASLEEAADHAATILKSARQPLITGAGTDVSGCRAAVSLAEKCGAVLDHMHGDAAFRNLQMLQARGWMLTTLSELKSRADLVVIAGADCTSRHPRFFERFLAHSPGLAAGEVRTREIVFLGQAPDRIRRAEFRGVRSSVIQCNESQLVEILAALRALARGSRLQPGRPLPGRRLGVLRRLHERLHAARYGVIVWAPAEYSPEHGDVLVRGICDLIVELNRKTRFAGLPLGGNDGGSSFQNVLAWQSGYPLRVNFASGSPDYDPYLYGTRKMLASRAADAVVWISSFGVESRPPPAEVPTVILARPSRRLALDAEVFIPVSVPGLHHSGTLFRADSVVALPVRGLQPSTAFPVAAVLAEIERRV
jgi:formylmethanofuran dehydrogenase subunit B